MAVHQFFLTIYTLGLLSFISGLSGIRVLAICAVRPGPGPLHLERDSDPQALVGCRAAGISLTGNDVNPDSSNGPCFPPQIMRQSQGACI